MAAHHIRRLPVLDYGALVGIVTLGDIREFQSFEANTWGSFETVGVLP